MTVGRMSSSIDGGGGASWRASPPNSNCAEPNPMAASSPARSPAFSRKRARVSGRSAEMRTITPPSDGWRSKRTRPSSSGASTNSTCSPGRAARATAIGRIGRRGGSTTLAADPVPAAVETDVPGDAGPSMANAPPLPVPSSDSVSGSPDVVSSRAAAIIRFETPDGPVGMVHGIAARTAPVAVCAPDGTVGEVAGREASCGSSPAKAASARGLSTKAAAAMGRGGAVDRAGREGVEADPSEPEKVVTGRISCKVDGAEIAVPDATTSAGVGETVPRTPAAVAGCGAAPDATCTCDVRSPAPSCSDTGGGTRTANQGGTADACGVRSAVSGSASCPSSTDSGSVGGSAGGINGCASAAGRPDCISAAKAGSAGVTGASANAPGSAAGRISVNRKTLSSPRDSSRLSCREVTACLPRPRNPARSRSGKDAR